MTKSDGRDRDRTRNYLFQEARERLRTPSGAVPSRRELADLVNVYLRENCPAEPWIDARYIGKIERGIIGWPRSVRRTAFREVLTARTDADLGFTTTADEFVECATSYERWAALEPRLVSSTDANVAVERAVSSLAQSSPSQSLTAMSPATGGLTVPPPGTERSALVAAAQRARRFALLTAEGGTSADVVVQLRDDVSRLTTNYAQRPLSEFLGDLVETQDTIFTLAERRQTPAISRELHFLAAVAAGLLAKASHDLAEPHAAMLQARTAVLCADQADHDGLRAWLRGLQSLVAYWAGRYAESVRYAEQGMQYASRAGGTTSVWLPVSAARAYAALGNATAATAAIRVADEAWEQVQPDDVDELGGIATFSRARTLYYAADALAWLPEQADKGQRYALDAVDAYNDRTDPSWAFGDEAGARSDLAVIRVASRDLEGAAEALAPVLELPPTQRMHGIVVSVQHVHRAIVTAGLAGDGRDLVDGIEDFTRTPAAALPR